MKKNKSTEKKLGNATPRPAAKKLFKSFSRRPDSGPDDPSDGRPDSVLLAIKTRRQARLRGVAMPPKEALSMCSDCGDDGRPDSGSDERANSGDDGRPD